MAIGSLALLFLLILGILSYRDIDPAIFAELPEALLTLMALPEGTDVAGLAYGPLYGTYGALTLAGLAVAMGAAAIAGEERRGSIGLLLANPKSRSSVLVSKASSMVCLTALGALFLWATGLGAAAVFDFSIAGMHLGAMVLHMLFIALFFGFLGLAIGAWTGSTIAAGGGSAGVMAISVVATSVLPLVEGFENIAKASPWHYFIGSQPLINGIDWGHIGVLVAGIAALLVLALIGLNRRDLRGRTVGVTLMDRLRDQPLTHKLADRVAGTVRVSHIWVKAASERQGLLLVTSGLMFLVMGVMMGPMFTPFDDALAGMFDQIPEALVAFFGGGDMTTPEGWYQIQTFGMMAPLAVIAVTVAIGARSLAGEEENRTMGLLLANPIKRSTIVLHTVAAMVLYGGIVGVATFAGVSIGSLLAGLGMDIAAIAATSLLGTLVGLVFGALALALGAATGRVKVAVYGTVGIALVMYVLNAFLPFSDRFSGYARFSPFYYYLTSDPLVNGMHWGHGAILTALTVVLVALAFPLFNRRDLRQVG